MTVGTPPGGTSGLAARGHTLDSGADGPHWSSALSGLSAELRSMGVRARTDRVVGAVDAVADGPRPRVQQALLRPHRGRLWWWLDCGADPALPPPHRTPLAPAARPAEAARRIARVLRARHG
ncbi:hypothetical protein [Streptomonospora salina]|uniref:Uncharacterized protein n=1 Tax=Streptomonospora salina TaxID=104205 RepID=A0A841DYB0_9ACTN|nr:hypothetical protein [Streptomonospora salina]MBB5996417.1 hypothetical protein [Streptomonospora salina]